MQKAAIAVLSVAVLATGGCALTSDGLELDTTGNSRLADMLISWDSVDGSAGTMTAIAADGSAYVGSYVQVSPQVRADQLAPLWEGWDATRGWRSWREEAGPAFIQAYDGMVLANLSTAAGEHLRCRFVLDFPSLGMDGGGTGKCQFPSGRTIHADLSGDREEHARTGP